LLPTRCFCGPTLWNRTRASRLSTERANTSYARVGGSRHARAAIRPARAWRRFLLQWMPARASSSSSLFGCHREALHARDAPGAGMRPLSRRSHLSRTDDLESRSSIRKIRLWRAPDRQHCRPPKRLRAAWFPWRPVGAWTFGHVTRSADLQDRKDLGIKALQHRETSTHLGRGTGRRARGPSGPRGGFLARQIRMRVAVHDIFLRSAIRVRDDLMLETNNSALSICQTAFWGNR